MAREPINNSIRLHARHGPDHKELPKLQRHEGVLHLNRLSFGCLCKDYHRHSYCHHTEAMDVFMETKEIPMTSMVKKTRLNKAPTMRILFSRMAQKGEEEGASKENGKQPRCSSTNDSMPPVLIPGKHASW
eukprot:GHVN01092027.1.p2 GENE.GHVN01092027.1~~GHVN01092027.1.p2  ORF type:complete len:131 (+),score=12.29 GHVN01092027.1:297-689(+)